MSNNYKLKITTPTVELVLNTRRGLAITELCFPKIDKGWLVGTILHGSYHNVAYSADFYSGHTLAEVFGGHKLNDLVGVTPAIKEDKEFVEVIVHIKLNEGTIEKIFKVSKNRPQIILQYKFDLKGTWSTFRTGKVTLNPDAFDLKSLYYECHNGGVGAEKFFLKNTKEMSPGPLSFSLSSPGCLGNTTGRLVIGDSKHKLILENDPAECAALPIIHFVSNVDGRSFVRVAYSLCEFDDTRIGRPTAPIRTSFTLSITG